MSSPGSTNPGLVCHHSPYGCRHLDIEGCDKKWRMRVMPDKAATDLIRNAMQAGGDYNAKVMEFAAANTHAAFEYIRKLQGAKSPSEVIELTSNHMREQSEILTEQAKQLAQMAQKLLPKMGDLKGFGSS
jgi:hypothetical protein